MFKVISNFFDKIFPIETNALSNLEAYIVAGNPQDNHDIDRLEQEYNRKQADQWVRLYLK